MSGELVSHPRLINPSIPNAISDIVLRAMAPDVSARYQRATELLDDVLAARAPSSRRHRLRQAPRRRPHLPRRSRRNPRLVLRGPWPNSDANSDASAARPRGGSSQHAEPPAKPRDSRRALLLAVPQAASRAHRPLPVLQRSAVAPQPTASQRGLGRPPADWTENASIPLCYHLSAIWRELHTVSYLYAIAYGLQDSLDGHRREPYATG